MQRVYIVVFNVFIDYSYLNVGQLPDNLFPDITTRHIPEWTFSRHDKFPNGHYTDMLFFPT
jgi:hypothetical protein